MPPQSINPKPYDPTATQPLGEQQPMEIPALPASTTAIPEQPKPRPEQGPPQTTNKVAGIAYIANNILRGFAQGRQQAEMHKVATMKRTVDGQGFAYQTTAQNLHSLVRAKLDKGADPKTVMQDPEVVQAVAARDAAWAGWMKSIGQMQQAQDGGGGKPKKSKSKPMDEKPPNPVVGLMSQDPQEKAAAWYQIAAKAGPPDRFGIDELIANGPRMSADRATLEAESSHAKDTATLEQRMDELRAKERQPIPSTSHTISTGEVTGEGASGGGGSAAAPAPGLPAAPHAASPLPSPTPTPAAPAAAAATSPAGSAASAAAPKSNLSEAEQRELKEGEDELVRRGVRKAGETGIKLVAPRAVATTTGADLIKLYPNGVPGPNGTFMPRPTDAYKEIVYGEQDGKPLVRYEPMTQPGQLKTTAGPGGQPVQIVFNPLTKTWENAPIGFAPQKGEWKVVKTRDAKGNEVEALMPVAPIYKSLPLPPGLTPVEGTSGGYQGPERRAEPHSAAHTTHAAHPAPAAAEGAGAASNVPPGMPSGTKVFPAFQQKNQDTYKALNTMYLTLYGKPGTSDKGFKASTIKALDSPEQTDKIAVAIKALDASAKQALSGHDETDFGYIQEFEKEWNNIPAVKGVMKDLNNDSKAYISDFFRAWTNAALIRSLSGQSRGATQSMYAMLSSELPSIGVNVHSKEDAERYLVRLENDVATAKSNLPQDMQEELDKENGRKSTGAGGSFDGDQPKPHEVDAILDGIFGKPKGQ